jgi:hypothetical protein
MSFGRIQLKLKQRRKMKEEIEEKRREAREALPLLFY